MCGGIILAKYKKTKQIYVNTYIYIIIYKYPQATTHFGCIESLPDAPVAVELR